jgi:hypothetical protein
VPTAFETRRRSAVLLTRLFINSNIDPVIVIGAVNMCKNYWFYPILLAFSVHISVWKTCGKPLLKEENSRGAFLSTDFHLCPQPGTVEMWKLAIQISKNKGFTISLVCLSLCKSRYTKRCKSAFN